MSAAVVLAVAAMLTGHPTQLSTDMSVCAPNTYGCADTTAYVIHLEPYLADMLTHLETVQPYQAALAVYVFGHEIAHLRGTLDEAKADRWAMRSSLRVARLLGASKPWIARMLPWVGWWDALTNGRRLPR